MYVKVGSQVWDSKVCPIMVVLSDEDKNNIANMSPKDAKYLSYPETMTEDEAREFMNLPETT